MPGQPVHRRIFLVGCARSGTTLLQSLLASHPEITSFPESHFFPHLLPGRKWARRTGLISRRAARRYDAFLAAIGRPERSHPRLPLAGVYARAFVHLLDSVALEEGKAAWLEKTPENLRYIDAIETYVPDAAFIHIVRSGPDVVASLYSASHKSSKGFSPPLSVDQCIERWRIDLEITRRLREKPNHFVVRYETLVSDTQSVLERVCAFLGLPFDQRMVDGHREAAQRVIQPWEHWKAGTLDPIRNANGTKLFDVFSADEREQVVARTGQVELPPET